MIIYTNNPQSVINGFYSATRNVLVISTIGWGVYGFSGTFKIPQSESILKIISIIMFSLSSIYCLNMIYYYHKYLNKLEKDPKLPKYIDINYTRRALYIILIYAITMIIITILAIRRLINRVI